MREPRAPDVAVPRVQTTSRSSSRRRSRQRRRSPRARALLQGRERTKTILKVKFYFVHVGIDKIESRPY